MTAPSSWSGKFAGKKACGGEVEPPPAGGGAGGGGGRLEENLFPFVKLCARVLSDKPLFVILNSYTTGLAPSVLGYILQMLVGKRFGGRVTWDELGLPCTQSGMALPCGATGVDGGITRLIRAKRETAGCKRRVQ